MSGHALVFLRIVVGPRAPGVPHWGSCLKVLFARLIKFDANCDISRLICDRVNRRSIRGRERRIQSMAVTKGAVLVVRGECIYTYRLTDSQ